MGLTLRLKVLQRPSNSAFRKIFHGVPSYAWGWLVLMRNSASLLLTLLVIVAVGLGCSLVGHAEKKDGKDQPANKTLKDHGVDIAVGDKKIGIQECDDVVDFFNREIDNPDDDFVTKAAKKTILNQFKEQFRQAVEENKTDKVQLAKVCKDFRDNLEKYKAESESNKK